MGKDLKGKELGVNLSQRKDKKYLARFTDKSGKRHAFVSVSLMECKKWLADTIYDYETTDLLGNEKNISVQAWYEYWIDFKTKTIKPTSVQQYKNEWEYYLKPIIGKMLMKDVKVQHCQMILNKMAESGKTKKTITTVKGSYINFFTMAIDYGILDKNPMSKANHKMGKESRKRVAMTIEEQKKFLQSAMGTSYELIFRFLLQTGLRISELIGLKWCDIDFDKRILTVNRQLRRENNIGWSYSEPKSKYSNRDIVLTDEAIRILKIQKEFNKSLKVILIEWSEIVFLSKKGMPTCSDTIDNDIKRICRINNLKNISCHVMRHTFATRCIEAGMNPKTLQKLMGHSNLAITMDLYVTVTDETKQIEMEKVQRNLLVI